MIRSVHDRTPQHIQIHVQVASVQQSYGVKTEEAEQQRLLARGKIQVIINGDVTSNSQYSLGAVQLPPQWLIEKVVKIFVGAPESPTNDTSHLQLHDSCVLRHSGQEINLEKVPQIFSWPRMRSCVK
ncbi:hypothetical protein AgCh_030611 [Apium graveolens]